MPRLEVRCCCDPNIVFGTLPIDALPRQGLRIPISLGRASVRAEGKALVVIPARVVSLEVGRVRDADGREAFAIKSGELELDDLLQIPGFERAR